MPDLDAWLPDPTVRTHRCRGAEASPDVLWEQARTMRLADTGTLGRLVRWRIPGTPATRTYDELFRTYPFVVLEEGERHLVSGLCGRIWTLRRDYPRIDGAKDFLSWEEPGTARVLLAHWIELVGHGQSALVSETRIKPVDGRARLRIRALWALVGHFEPLIEREALRNAIQRAEQDQAR